PLIAKLRTQRLVHFNRLLIPVEHFPMNAVAVFLDGNPRHCRQQLFSDSSPAKLFAHKKILQKQSWPRPSRIVIEDEGIPGRLPLPLGNQCAEFRICSEPIPHQILLLNFHKIQFVLELRQLTNQSAKQTRIGNGCRTNREHCWCKTPKSVIRRRRLFARSPDGHSSERSGTEGLPHPL